jgi:hypothetical protein
LRTGFLERSKDDAMTNAPAKCHVGAVVSVTGDTRGIINHEDWSSPRFPSVKNLRRIAVQHEHINLSILAFTCAILSAKWAMELGFSQLRQAIWGVAGLFLGPLALLILYIRLLGSRQAARESGGQWVSGNAEPTDHEFAKPIPATAHR